MALDLKRLVKLVNNADLIVTPRYEQYLMSGRYDEPFPEWIIEIIADQLRGAKYDATGTFRASAAGKCFRFQELRMAGVDPQEVISTGLAAIFDDGSWRHLRWQAHLLNAAILDEIEVKAPWERMHSVATMDGVGTVPADHPHTAWRGKKFGFELKGANPFGYRKDVKVSEEPKIAHLRQIHRAILQSGLELYVGLYEDKATQDWHEWVIEPDQKYLEEQRAELKALNDDFTSGELHEMLPECRRQVGPTFRFCPYGTKHGACVAAGDLWPDETEVERLSNI